MMAREMDSADVAVVGGGVIGMATAYFTAKRGKDVILLERGIPGWEASGRNGGWAGGGMGDPIQRENTAIWATLEDELGESIEFVRGGSLNIALTESEVLRQDRTIENAKTGLQVLDLQQMREILPGVSDRALRGTFNPNGSQANPHLTCQAWIWALQRIGVRILLKTEVTGLIVEDDQVIGVETQRGFVKTSNVVNAAGPWAYLVNEMAGLTLPPLPVLIEILCTLPLPPITKATFGGNVLYCRQALSGHLHLGGWNAVAKDLRMNSVKETSSLVTGDIAKRFVEMVPGLKGAKMLRTWAGVIARTPDDAPIIDALDTPKGFFVNMGFGGGGFAFSPIAGKIVSELIVDGETQFDITAYSANRVASIGDFDTMAREPI